MPAGHESRLTHAVVVLCPMQVEHARVHHELRRAGLDRVACIQTGIGREAILRTLDTLAQPALVILAGAAGGLIACEDVPPIAKAIDEHGRSWTPFAAAPAGVTVIGVDTIISTPDDKRALAARTGAAIVDMECHAFAARCEEMGVAWSVVRGVSDTPEETLPHEVLGWITPGGDTRTGRAVLDMVKRPSLVPHIAGFVRRSNRVLPLVGRRVVEIVRVWEQSRVPTNGRAS